MQGGVTLSCTGNYSSVSNVGADVCLDWWSGTQWVQQSCSGWITSDYPDGDKASTPVYHSCTSGGYHTWRSRANGYIVWNGSRHNFPTTTNSANVVCQ
jgi:hypothetical protein